MIQIHCATFDSDFAASVLQFKANWVVSSGLAGSEPSQLYDLGW
jgi:hypothetical protein